MKYSIKTCYTLSKYCNDPNGVTSSNVVNWSFTTFELFTTFGQFTTFGLLTIFGSFNFLKHLDHIQYLNNLRTSTLQIWKVCLHSNIYA
jgi:hypothetical protein